MSCARQHLISTACYHGMLKSKCRCPDAYEKESRISEISRELTDIQAAKAVNNEPIDLTELTGNINEQSERLKLHQHLKRQLKTIVLYPSKKSIDILVNEGDDIHLNYDENTEIWTSGDEMSFKVEKA